jgi:serine/threonine protein kinase
LAITPGTRLGVYEVTTQIGAGGMVEIYRSTDSNLKRSMAVKVLPASVASDADRLARFNPKQKRSRPSAAATLHAVEPRNDQAA